MNGLHGAGGPEWTPAGFGPSLTPQRALQLRSALTVWIADAQQRLAAATGQPPDLLRGDALHVVDRAGFAAVMASITPAFAPSAAEGGAAHRLIVRAMGRGLGRLLSGRVAGLYVPAWQAGEGDPGLYLLPENIDGQAAVLSLDPGEFAHYVAFHETVHQWQHTAHPWLNVYVPQVQRHLLLTARPRDLLAQARTGNVAATPQMARVTAVMSLLEGHADFMTSHLGRAVIPGIDTIDGSRSRDDAAEPLGSPVARAVNQALGFEAKQRQYSDGRAFCEAVHAAGGMPLLTRVWENRTTLPTLDELAEPGLWVARMTETPQAA